MSDAQSRADTGDGDADPAPLPHALLSEAGVDPAAVVAVPTDTTFDDPPIAPAHDTGKEQSTPIAVDAVPDTPVTENDAPPLDIAQPALDVLPAPESSPLQVPAPDQAIPLESLPDTSRDDAATDEEDAPAPDAPVVVSPIFSALDAAERAAEAAQRYQAPPQGPAADTGILIPLSQLRDEEADNTSPVSLLPPQAPDAHSPAPPPPSDNIVVIDVDAASEEPPLETDASPHAQEQPPPPETPLNDTSARIAAEASATALALENLKRLLEQKAPTPSFTAPPNPHRDEIASSPPPIPTLRPAIQLPVMPPPMVPAPPGVTSLTFADHDDPPPRRGRTMAVGSFFAGFALSWVFGAVLYVYLISG